MWRLALFGIVLGCGDGNRPAVCPPDETCDCTDGEEQLCAGGTDVGACSSGSQRCTGGIWGPCEDRIEPAGEACNGVDDDCDGVVDGASAAASCPVVANSSGASCDGECAPVCATGFDDCNGDYADGCETDLGVSATCGACGVQCPSDEFCELGSCTALPQILWSAAFGPNQPYDLVMDDAGRMHLASEIQTSIVLGTQTIAAPSPAQTSHLLTTRIDTEGTPDWFRVDGENTFGELAALDDGTSYVVGNGAVVSFDGTAVGPHYLVAFDSQGGAQWAVTLNSAAPVGRPVVGSFGVDVADAGNLRRFSPTGEELSSRALPPNARPLAQLADGSTLVQGRSSTSLSPSCAPLADATLTHYYATISTTGECTLDAAFAVSSNVFLDGALRLPDGRVLVAGSANGSGTITSGPFTSAVTGRFTLVLDSVLQPISVGPDVGTLADSRGNTYARVASSGSVFVRSFRPDGVLRWEMEVTSSAFVSPGTTMHVNSAGKIGLSVSAFDVGPVTLNGVELPASPIAVLVLEAK